MPYTDISHKEIEKVTIYMNILTVAVKFDFYKKYMMLLTQHDGRDAVYVKIKFYFLKKRGFKKSNQYHHTVTKV